MSHRYLVLGLLSEAPMTGYDIKKRVCETMGMIASPSYGAVYQVLHRLLEEGAG
jgi:DNA-binding PadR family transcriptional regulator